MRCHRDAAQAALLSADRLERGPGAAVGQHLRGERQAAAGGRCTAHFEDVRRLVWDHALQTVDHQHLNDFLPNPTAEHLVVYLWHVLV
jgi:hypothetical protein